MLQTGLLLDAELRPFEALGIGLSLVMLFIIVSLSSCDCSSLRVVSLQQDDVNARIHHLYIP